jgi:hypothetical protein
LARLPPPARPAILGGMDQEREDYADPDVPGPRFWTGDRVLGLLLLLLALSWVPAVLAFIWTALRLGR